ncbi:TCTP-like protein [Mya arenaria]|uniref:TCTP-like protein n=1 Tax=Mya arenaria TaxID=6604 RepID=A0ABY7FZE2_MYAAR|nr:TCTP-like protein [Mya arenaria]
MIVFKDRITGDELFSDSFKMSEVFDGLMYKVHCCMTVKSGDALDPSAFGLNPSAEEQEEQVDDCGQEKGLDICLFHKVEECPAIDSKKSVSSYLKKYLKK